MVVAFALASLFPSRGRAEDAPLHVFPPIALVTGDGLSDLRAHLLVAPQGKMSAPHFQPHMASTSAAASGDTDSALIFVLVIVGALVITGILLIATDPHFRRVE
jgi:hypothetical protein